MRKAYETDENALGALAKRDALRDQPEDPVALDGVLKYRCLPDADHETSALAFSDNRAEYSEKFDAALALAAIVHDGVPRKGTRIPYIMHPVHVARLLDRHGLSEDVVLAGLLHDVLEDAEFGDPTLRTALAATFPFFSQVPALASRRATETFIRSTFGEHTLRLVESVTELKRDGDVERPWRLRKEEQIAHVAQLSPEGAALKAADALHNARAIYRDVGQLGLDALSRFKCSPEELLWFYGAIAGALRDRLHGHSIVRDLDQAVRELTERASKLLSARRTTIEHHGS